MSYNIKFLKNNTNIQNLYINMNHFNISYIKLNFENFLKKDIIYISYETPSFYLDGIYFRFINNIENIKILPVGEIFSENYNNNYKKIKKTYSCVVSNQNENIDNSIKSQNNYLNKNKSLKSKIGKNYYKKYEIDIELDKDNELIIDKLLDCNNKIFTMIKYNINFKKKTLENKNQSPVNINTSTLLSKIYFNSIITKKANRYVIRVQTNYKLYKKIKDYIENLNIDTNNIKKSYFNIHLKLNKVIVNNEILPIIEMVDFFENN
jgi:hypothetical protein